ncbi:hypothetical protein DICTH_0290 [Dictyoglomus thermophilum H-6-12]|uniref:Uncharacterized protein n=1 Tax=Dictyoglomus thermophilum (strain ATCC 35947 / DSM 3960 / H-6-12) TaxID=309799 RepID=B5YC65_DICT6|nr:hypothetical protein DICTH_0290 [Dictyoglomus thermophilum H-6-12]
MDPDHTTFIWKRYKTKNNLSFYLTGGYFYKCPPVFNGTW